MVVFEELASASLDDAGRKYWFHGIVGETEHYFNPQSLANESSILKIFFSPS